MRINKSISRKLLVSVLSAYFILTFIVTCGQIYTDYISTKNSISKELENLEKTFSDSLTRAIWELHVPQVVSISEGLLEIPVVEGVIIRDDKKGILTKMGNISSDNIENLRISELSNKSSVISDDDGLFGYTFPLIFDFLGRSVQVGDVTLFSSREIVLSRIYIPILFLLLSATIKTMCLVFLFSFAFRKLLTSPLTELTNKVKNIDLEYIEDSHINLKQEDKNELTIIQHSVNELIDKIASSQNELKQTQKELIKTNDILDQQNLMLEQEVAKKAANLSTAMMDLQKQKYQLEVNQKILKEEIETRGHTESELRHKTQKLEETVSNLRLTQGRLVESEKLAALGGLVASITHDVNTPIGVSVTAASYLSDRLQELQTMFDNQSLKAKDMAAFISDGSQSVDLLSTNLARASELIASFKQIAVDQASEAVRTINLKTYIQEIITSIRPKFKNKQLTINVSSTPENIQLTVPAGAISQIFTNFIMNSVIHGLENVEGGIININIEDIGQYVNVEYKDNGIGVTPKQLKMLFEPFYTTKLEQGGSGLGTNIAYNLVKQTLKGDILASSGEGQGLTYQLRIPKTL